jgi:hypothetical protein
MVRFYARLGFDEQERIDFAPAPVRVVKLRNRASAMIELTERSASTAAPAAHSPVEAAVRRGPSQAAVAAHDGLADRFCKQSTSHRPHPSGARPNPVPASRAAENRSSKPRRNHHFPVSRSMLNRGG